MAQSVDFFDDVENVFMPTCLVRDDHSEEVGDGEQGLVAHHQVTFVHHATFDYGGDLVQLLGALLPLGHVPDGLGNVPETHVEELRLKPTSLKPFGTTLRISSTSTYVLKNELEFVFFVDEFDEIVPQLEHEVHVCLHAHTTLSSPHEPELEDVDMSPTLNGLVPCVIGHVVVLVLLEQIVRVQSVATFQQTLKQNSHYTLQLQ